MKFKLLVTVLLPILLNGCAGPGANLEKARQTLFLTGTVLKIQGSEAEIAVRYAEPTATPETFVAELAQKVGSKAVFVEGGRTEINGVPVLIDRVTKEVLVVKAEKGGAFAEGDSVSISVPKKTIAVVDFEVINAPRSDMAKILRESLTSELVESGQFTVLERAKLKPVLDEIKLSQSGLTQESSETMVGKVLNADVILTGTLAETGGDWTVNLRIVNVRTSQAIAAIAYKSSLFKPSDLRDTSLLSEDFEGDSFPSWNLGYQSSGEDHYKVSVDRSTGAEGSTSSLRVDFDFIHDMSYFANATTYTKRDLSSFQGIEFYVKGTEGLNAYVNLLSSQPDDPNKINNRVAHFEMSPEWRKIRIPFDSFVVGRSWINGGAKKFGAQPGDQLLRLNRIEAVRVGLMGRHLPIRKGTFWIDRVSFYR